MRHLATLIAAVVIAPLAWIMAAYGEDRSVQAFAKAQSGGGFRNGDFLRPLVLLAVAGLLLGLIATLRFSPLGAMLAGIGYSASYVALLIDPQRVLDLLPDKLSIAGTGVDPTTPLRSGTAMLLGALLLVAVVSIGRWVRPRAAETARAAGLSRESSPSVLAGAGPVSLADDRPLGADGLGLSGSGWPPEPEMATRYPSRPERGTSSRRYRPYF